MTLVTFLLVFLLAPASPIAQDNEGFTEYAGYVTKGPKINGKTWDRLDAESRLTYLVGVADGAALLAEEIARVKEELGKGRAGLPAIDRLSTKGFNYGDFVDEVDRFYARTSNRKIPILDAYRHVLRGSKGASSTEMSSALFELREKYNP